MQYRLHEVENPKILTGNYQTFDANDRREAAQTAQTMITHTKPWVVITTNSDEFVAAKRVSVHTPATISGNNHHDDLADQIAADYARFYRQNPSATRIV